MYDRTKARKSGEKYDENLDREKSRALGHALRAAINTPIQVCGTVFYCIVLYCFATYHNIL